MSKFLPSSNRLFSLTHKVKGFTNPRSILMLGQDARPLLRRLMPMSKDQYTEAAKHYAKLWREAANKHYRLRTASATIFLPEEDRRKWINGGVNDQFPAEVNTKLRELTQTAQSNHDLAFAFFYTAYTKRKAIPEWLQFEGVMVYSFSE
jgi:hypothetical protein